MKPRIFIAMHYMEIGGAESSLIGLLEALDPERVDVDLFIYSHQGLFMKAIPEYVNLLPEVGAYSMMEEPLFEVVKKGYIRVALARLIAKYKAKKYVKAHPTDCEQQAIFGYIGREMSKVVPDLKKYGEYDLAISYLQPHNFILNHVRAKKKICWIHTDYSKVELNRELELPVWGGYDRIVSISPDVTKGFLSKFPSLKDKILELENILPKSYIEERANDSLEIRAESLEYGKKNILTLCSVGRISYAKNYDNIPRMAAALKELFMGSNSSNGSSSSNSGLNSSSGSGSSNIGLNSSSSSNGLNREALNCSASIEPVEPQSDQLNQASAIEPNEVIEPFEPKYTDFKWYIVGPGDHSEIDKLSEELVVKENVVFLGPSDNPYPFIKNCDIYVHPSRFEGKSIVVREAQILCKPVVITNYPTAHSQINDGVDGVICVQDNKMIAETIFELANDKNKQSEIINHLQTHDNAGLEEVNKIYSLL